MSLSDWLKAHWAGLVSRGESNEMVVLAQRLRQEVGDWLEANHPELL